MFQHGYKLAKLGAIVRPNRSLHDSRDTVEVDAAWRAEASRRLTETRAGAVAVVDADEHYARLRASLTA